MVEIYPSIKYKLVKCAVTYFAQVLSLEDKEKIDTCLKMVKFGMGNTLLTFIDKYYGYGGEEDVEERRLTIGGYELAWLADLVASYILENMKEHFKETHFKGIYCDDRIVIFKGNLKASEVGNWIKMFQVEVDELAGSNYLKFTAEVWGEDKHDGSIQEAVTVRGEDNFLYLDMEMFWSKRGELQFRVHLRANQQLKYLEQGKQTYGHVFPSDSIRSTQTSRLC